MKTAYIIEQGATLRRDGAVLQVWTGRKRRAELLVHDLDQLVLMGNVMVTPGVLDFLIAERVDTVFMSLHGRFRGRLMHEHSKNVHLRLVQYRQLQTPEVVMSVARAIVRGVILYPPRGQRLTYRQVIEEQVRHFARTLLGTEPAYEPFLIR